MLAKSRVGGGLTHKQCFGPRENETRFPKQKGNENNIEPLINEDKVAENVAIRSEVDMGQSYRQLTGTTAISV